MLRNQPPDRSASLPSRALPVPFPGPGTPPDGGASVDPRVPRSGMKTDNRWAGLSEGENASDRELENEAQEDAGGGEEWAQDPEGIDFLRIVRDAEGQSQLYTAQVNRKAWSQSYRAFHNEHFIGSKYIRPEWRSRSRLFVPKTRGSVRKDNAAVAASLFNSMDAISCRAGNESDPNQRAAAAIMQELVNYRTDRASGKASFPWFLIAMGARQDSMLAGVCCSKQYWKHEYRKIDEEEVEEEDKELGIMRKKTRDVFALEVDRPDICLFPPENVIIDPAAPWTEVAQKAAYFILKYPMTIDEILEKQNNPVNPWRKIPEETLRQAVNGTKQDQEAIRRAREMGLDRFNETQTGTDFQVVWVYECFLRTGGEDWNFWSLGSEHYLTDPAPTRKNYPEQFGERPIAFGFAQLESHRIFPMSPVESWQPLQVETNDLRNLMLDATKQNVMPISKVRRGRRIDMDQVKRRAAGSSIFVDDKDDVTWEQPPSVPEQTFQMSQRLDIELDDLAGQQNYGNVEQSNALGKTLGGLRLAAGAANAVQEYDIRVWLETWCQPALAQIVRLEQYYESDPVVLGLCGQRAQLMVKYGVDQITDKLLEDEIMVTVDIGLGAGDPQQRLLKFQSAVQVVAPLLAGTPEFQSGQVELNWEEVFQEVFGAVGYRDGGMRFVKVNAGPKPNPMGDLKTQELQAKIEKDKKTGNAAMMTGLSQLAKVALGKRELEADLVDTFLTHQLGARELGIQHAHERGHLQLSAFDHGSRHGHAILEHRRNTANDQAMQAQNAAAAQEGEGAGQGAGPAPPRTATSSAGSPSPPSAPSASSPPQDEQEYEFIRHPETNAITGARVLKGGQAAHEHGAHAKQQEDRIAQLEAMVAQLSKKKKRRAVKDAHGGWSIEET